MSNGSSGRVFTHADRTVFITSTADAGGNNSFIKKTKQSLPGKGSVKGAR